jgi:hypothetical protein
MMMGKRASTQQYLISRRLLNFCVHFRRIFYAFAKVCKIEIYGCFSIVNLCDPASDQWVPGKLAKCMFFLHSLFKNTTPRYRGFERFGHDVVLVAEIANVRNIICQEISSLAILCASLHSVVSCSDSIK